MRNPPPAIRNTIVGRFGLLTLLAVSLTACQSPFVRRHSPQQPPPAHPAQAANAHAKQPASSGLPARTVSLPKQAERRGIAIPVDYLADRAPAPPKDAMQAETRRKRRPAPKVAVEPPRLPPLDASPLKKSRPPSGQADLRMKVSRDAEPLPAAEAPLSSRDDRPAAQASLNQIHIVKDGWSSLGDKLPASERGSSISDGNSQTAGAVRAEFRSASAAVDDGNSSANISRVVPASTSTYDLSTEPSPLSTRRNPLRP